MSSTVTVSYTLPEEYLLDLMQTLVEMKGKLEQEGVASHIDIGTSTTSKATPTEDTVEPPAPVPPMPVGRKKVVYRVIDPSIIVGPIPYNVRMLLLTNGPMSAQKIEEISGMGKKSVESSLWSLRNKKSIESVEAIEGTTVTQPRFTRTQINLGRPILGATATKATV